MGHGCWVEECSEQCDFKLTVRGESWLYACSTHVGESLLHLLKDLKLSPPVHVRLIQED